MPVAPLTHNQAGSLARSVNENQPDFQMELTYTDSTVNMTSGIQEGIGPRYGMAPIPRHSDTAAVGAGLNPGLMKAETVLSGTATRTKVLGIFPVEFGGYGANVNMVGTYYLWVLQFTDSSYSGEKIIDVFPSSIQASSICQQSPAITDGFFPPTVDDVNITQLPIQYISGPEPTGGPQLARLLNIGEVNFISATTIAISGPSIAQSWLFGTVTAVGDATHAPSSCLFADGTSGGIVANFAGCPPNYIYGNFVTSARTILVTALNGDATFNIGYSIPVTPSTSVFKPNGYLDIFVNTPNIDLSGSAGTKLTGGTTYSNTKMALYYDPANFCSSAYQAVLLASAKPVAIIIQDWYRDASGRLPQYFDLVNARSEPIKVTSSRYTENGQQVATCFNSWPNFVRGTAMVTDATIGTALGASNTGLLRKNTVYEFTYSKYNKRLNFESNVGMPVKIQTGGTDDFTSLILFNAAVNATNLAQGIGGVSLLPWPSASNTNVAQDNGDYLNFLEYRFYYRQEGMEVWLPAVFVDAARFWYDPNVSALTACTGGIGGTPGGEAGAFQDYSLLPQDNYSCVVMYKNRVFWLSNKNLVFSLTNNIFAYAARNSAACPVGAFKGALVQAYYGQAAQDARLVIFSTDGTYVGKFTGQQQVASLTLDTASPPTVAQFPLDGSDFVINTWTSVTAFSYRSAVVAEGLLFFWGPQGVFLDDGVNPIQRISVPLEPQIFKLYDTSQTDTIFCEYNDVTKEIIWFFPPAVADASYPTYGLLYNKLKGQFLPLKFAGQIDNAQSLHIDQGIPIGGTRTVVMSRASSASTIQRAYFFDQNNLACDIYPGGELLVASFTSPTNNTRLLTLASGHSTGTIAAGDFIAFQQCAAYANGGLVSPLDFIATVTATGGGTITVQVPDSVASIFDQAETMTEIQYLPIWHVAGNGRIITGNGINGFSWVLDSKFWIPNGMSYWGYWLYLHLVYKLYDLLPSPIALTHLLNYQTPISGASGADMLTLVNNSANNCQIFHALAPGQQSFEGQGIKLTFSGIQLASSWILQFLESLSQLKDGQQLKIFEG